MRLSRRAHRAAFLAPFIHPGYTSYHLFSLQESPVPRRTKIIALIIFLIVLAAMLLLAFSLAQLDFRPGTPFSLEQSAVEAFGMLSWNSDLGILLFLRILLGLAILSIPFILVYLLFNKKARKRFIMFLIVAAALIMIGSGVVEHLSISMQPLQVSPQPVQAMPDLPQAPIARFEAAAPADLVVIAAVIGIALALAVVIGLLVFRRKPVYRQDEPGLEPLARPAEQAIQSLYAGGDLKEIVVRCYLDMCAAIDREQDIRRAGSMTVHEFERLLAQKGLPQEPVHSLTGLFEAARYSPEVPGAAEQQQALSSLQAILKACRRAA